MHALEDGPNATARMPGDGFRRLMAGTAAALAAALIAACGGGAGEEAAPPVAAQGFKLFPARVALAENDDGVLIAQSAPGPLTWSSSNPAAATVDASGRMKALARGETIISAASGGDVASTTVRVYRTSGANADPTSESLIAKALALGRINAEQALGYRVLALFADSRLPAEFEGAPSEHADHLLLREVSGRLPSLSPAAQELLAPFLIPPIYAESWHFKRAQPATADDSARAKRQSADRARPSADVTINCFLPQFSGATRTTDHFKIWGYFSDDLVGGDDGRPTTETYTDFIASVVEDVYRAEVDLFRREPLTDVRESCNGGDGKVDIYLMPIDMGGRMPAMTVAYPNRCAKVPAYIALNSMAMTLSLGRATVGSPLARNKSYWKSVIAHEFAHVLQFGMERRAGCDDYTWFDEATATWVMDHVEPLANFEDGGRGIATPGFARRQGRFLMNYLYNDHRVSIEKASPESDPDLNGYGDYLFFQYIARRFQPETIKQMLDATATLASVEAMASVVEAKGGMKAIWPDFAATLWNDTAGQVLDYWSIQDAYDIGLAAIYTPAGPQVASEKLKTLQVDQQGQRRASFKLLDNTLRAEAYEIEPRSMIYEHLKFSDPRVHSVLFFNPIGVLPDREFIKVQAKKKIGGQWRETEDWTAFTEKQFCLDKKDERLEELLIIVSNSQVDRGAETPFRIPKLFAMQLATSNVGCFMWVGNASVAARGGTPDVDIVSRGFSAAFRPAAVMPGRITFGTIGGVINGRQTNPAANCTATLVGEDRDLYRGLGSEVLPPTEDGTIDINLDLDLGLGSLGGPAPNRDLVTLSGSTILSTTTTLVCPTFTTVEVGPLSWDWLRVNDASVYKVSDDGQTIEGEFRGFTASGALLTTIWTFKAVRE